MSMIRRDRAHLLHSSDSSTITTAMGRQSARKGTLSIIVPAKNEAENLPKLVEEIVGVFRPLVKRRGRQHRLDGFEILVVDDGSTDETVSVLQRLSETYPELKPIFLASNIGQTGAIVAGFRGATGDWVGILDADLQNPPAELANLWETLPGFDAALGWRTTREDHWTKRWTSLLANRFRNGLLGQSIRDTGCSIRVFPREVALRLPMFRGAHRFFGPLLIREGCRIIQTPVRHRPRGSGTSHYHFGNRSVRVLIDLVGVAWLMSRPIVVEVVRPRLAEEHAPELRVVEGWGTSR